MGDRPSPKCPCPDCRSALKTQGVASTRDRVDAGMVARATDWCADKQNQKARTATFQNIDRVFGLCLDTTPLIKEKPLLDLAGLVRLLDLVQVESHRLNRSDPPGCRSRRSPRHRWAVFAGRCSNRRRLQAIRPSSARSRPASRRSSRGCPRCRCRRRRPGRRRRRRCSARSKPDRCPAPELSHGGQLLCPSDMGGHLPRPSRTRWRSTDRACSPASHPTDSCQPLALAAGRRGSLPPPPSRRLRRPKSL